MTGRDLGQELGRRSGLGTADMTEDRTGDLRTGLGTEDRTGRVWEDRTDGGGQDLGRRTVPGRRAWLGTADRTEGVGQDWSRRTVLGMEDKTGVGGQD